MTTMNIDAAALKQWLTDGSEIALLDAREELAFTDEGHILLASNAPLSRLEFIVEALVPRAETRVVVCDGGGDALADRAARRLRELGYTSVSVLNGGTPAWRAAGFPLYEGIYVPSKAFAEVVEHEAKTPFITAETLAAWQAEGRDLTIVDTRTFEEYHANTIPQSVSVPGGELVYRLATLVNDPKQTVVVNCGGRTRSIIGAQSLINAGVPNPVVSLKDGTMGWVLAGLDVAIGETREAGEPAPSEMMRAAARRVADSFGVSQLTPSALATQQAHANQTVYVLDVRTQSEFERGHWPESRHAPGGQLVQETDRHIAVWGASVVLIDDDGVRANMTASWLAQMGWSVSVMTLEPASLSATGPAAASALTQPDVPASRLIRPHELNDALSERVVLDLERSREHRIAHIPGARFIVRSRLGEYLASADADRQLVLTSNDGRLAQLAWGDHQSDARLLVLEGGTHAWRASGLPVEGGIDPIGPVDDCWYTPRDRDSNDHEKFMNAYLTWEANLVHDMARDELHRFGDVRSLGG